MSPGATAHYDDPAYYSRTYADRQADIAYYLKLARRTRGPVLECGVGNGRVALALARAGIEVVGVDRSAPMLADLRTRLKSEPAAVRARVQVHRADLRRIQLGRRFPLVIAPFNVVLHLYDRRDVEQFLHGVRRHLEPGAWLVFDYSVPRAVDLAVDPERRYGAPRVKHPTRGVVRYSERFLYDPLRQLLLCEMEFSPVDGTPSWRVPLLHRQFFPQEMAALLHYNGFDEQRWTSDFTTEPPASGSDSLVVQCRPRRARRRR